MTTFDDRERGEETKFKHDLELGFKIRNRRNKLFGLWIAQTYLGLAGEAATHYAKDVVMADFELPGDEDMIIEGAGRSGQGRQDRQPPSAGQARARVRGRSPQAGHGRVSEAEAEPRPATERPGEVPLPPTRGPQQPPGEVNGPPGPEPTRFGDWEKGGRCSDF